MRIGLCYNLKNSDAIKGPNVWDDQDAEYEDQETIDRLAQTLEEVSGEPVLHLPCDRDLPRRLERERPDLVFNISEGWGGRNREAYAPTLFEMYGIPYTGSDGLALSLTLDKVLAKKVMIADGLPTPDYFVVSDLSGLREVTLDFPLFVKPCHEGTSKGIRNFSRARNRSELEKVVSWVLDCYDQPVLIERFIDGHELAVSILGNGPECRVLPFAEIRFTKANPFYSFECKILVDEEVICPASLDPSLEGRIQEIAVKAYQSFGCRDFARLDLRLNEKKEPYIIEVNPLPGLSAKYSLFPIQAEVAGIDYKEMIRVIVDQALKRSHRDKAYRRQNESRARVHDQDREWKDQIRDRVREVEELSKYIRLEGPYEEWLKEVREELPFAVTPYLLSIADREDPSCPVRRQFLPSPAELNDSQGMDDPLAEGEHETAPGLIQVYEDRAAWCISSFCPSLCRHCLRRDRFQSREDRALTQHDMASTIDAVSRNPNIRDILLTGGDPLVYEDDFLEDLFKRLREIDHIQIIRLGTRLPATLPQRITKNLLKMLGQFQPLWISTQFNHPREITEESSDACIRIAEAGIPTLNQSVLLKGINDSFPVMKDLVERLVQIRARPYYLYQCQLIRGTAHFRTTVEQGMELMKNLRGRTSGFAIPLYLLDTPYGKVPLNPSYYKGRENGSVMMESFDGKAWTERNPILIHEGHDPKIPKCHGR